MANEPRNKQSQSNGCLKIAAILFVLGVAVVMIAFFTGKSRLPGEVTLEPIEGGSIPIPEPSDVELVRIQPDQDVEIVRTGLRLPYVTENCSSPVSTKETITHERMYTLGVELDLSESHSSEIVRELTGGSPDITQVEMSVAEDIAQEMSRSLGIRMNESYRVESSREIETPAGYRSSVSLQWEEAHTIGYATIRTVKGDEILIPFSYVSHMHLAQVETVYTSCADGTTVVSSSGGIPVFQSAVTAQNPVQIVSPANTECKNPVSFTWISEPNRQYRVTARPLSANSQAGVGSAWIEGGVWEEGLPADLWGSWEWYITRDDNVRSAPVVFVFNPFPTVNKNQGCSEARAGALDSSEKTVESLLSASSTPTAGVTGEIIEPVGLQEPSADVTQETPSNSVNSDEVFPTPTVLTLPTDSLLPPHPAPSAAPLVPTPEVEPTITPSAIYPYPLPPPPPTPFVYP